MKRIILILLLGFLTMQTGCSKYLAVQKNGSNVCLHQCKIHFSACNKTCNNSCMPCRTEAMNDAKVRYAHYTREREVTSAPNIRQLKSERDPLQCRKASCNCYADLLACQQACGGRINKALRVAPVCT